MKKSIRIVWFFTLALFLIYGCSETKKNTDEKIAGFELSKNIIYADDEKCEEVALFYHDLLGIPYKKNVEEYRWVEFETGSSKLCIHHNNKRDRPFDGGVINIVFYMNTQDEVLALHKRILKNGFAEISIVGAEKDKHLLPNQISELISWTTSKGDAINSFWVSDPVGNIVQIEPRHDE